MNRIFDLGEQLAELEISSSASAVTPISLMTMSMWYEFIVEDTREMLREKHFGGLNDRTTRLLTLLTNHYWARPAETELGDHFNRLRQHSIELFSDIGQTSRRTDKAAGEVDEPSKIRITIPDDVQQELNNIDDELDEVYYEIGNEVQEFVNEFYDRGDIWTVDLTVASKFLVFAFVCRKSSIEAAVRASGGNMGDFIRHITS